MADEIEFQVVEYNADVESGWTLATVDDVESNMMDAKGVLYDKEWHICALVDGTVSGRGYGYEITHEPRELGHKLIIKKPMADIEFQVAEYGCCDEGDWRCACVHEVEANMDKVQEALSDKEWHICALMDGTVAGPGYGHEITHETKELGHKLLIKCPTEFQILEYGCGEDPGWRMATVREVQAHMDKVEEALADKEWHICALVDGTVSGPGYGHEIGYEAKEMGHKMITNRPAPPVEFDVADYHCCSEGGWRMARIGEVRANMDKVKDLLSDKEWHICALVDGTVSGPGYGHEIGCDCKACGHKLVIKGGLAPPAPELQIAEYHEPNAGHWRLARVADVKANMEKVQEMLADKEWHICALVDGTVAGPGYGYEITNDVKELGHKVIINY